MINVNSPTFNKQLRKEKTPDGKSNYVFSDSDVMEIYNGAIHDMSYEQRELFKKNYIPKKMPTFENNFKQANYSNMLKITLKESEFRTLIEKTVRKALNEATLGHATDEDPVDDNVLPSELQDWLDENYPQEMREGMRGYEEIIQDLGEKNQLTSEIINFFVKNMNQYAESWMHNLNMFKERCERYKQYYNITE